MNTVTHTTTRWTLFSALVLATIAIAASAGEAAQRRGGVSVAVGHRNTEALSRWDAAIDRMARTGELVVTARLHDREFPGRTLEYLVQTVGGVPVHGSGISRQLDAGGDTRSLLGTLHQPVDIDTTPALSPAKVVRILEGKHSGRVVAHRQPALVVLPLPDGTYALSYCLAMSDARFYFASADDGRILRAVDAFRPQSAVGSGNDYRGLRKKLSTTQDGTGFLAHDRLRPAEIVTLDARFNLFRLDRLITGHFADELPAGAGVWTANDVATDADNDWDDPTVVEAHAYTGWTYDYLYARHGRQGLDGANGRILSIVNVELGGPDAFAVSPPFGPEGTGVYVYGRASDEASEEPLTSLDIVAHELMHGVTHFSVSQRTGNPLGLDTDIPTSTRLGPESFTDENGHTFTCDDGWWCIDGRFVLGSAQGSAVNEAYSDIVGKSVGFFHEDAGATANYLMGSDQTFGPGRSLADPGSISILDGFPYPDAYQNRYEFAVARITTSDVCNPPPCEDTDPPPRTNSVEEEEDEVQQEYSRFVFVNGRFAFSLNQYGYGGEHWNSTILSHAFYLAIEGGTNRTTGLRVQGVGDASRAEVERIFFRAMTDLMPAATSLPQAAEAIRQAAADLSGGGEARRAVAQALIAVGLPPAQSVTEASTDR